MSKIITIVVSVAILTFIVTRKDGILRLFGFEVMTTVHSYETLSPDGKMRSKACCGETWHSSPTGAYSPMKTRLLIILAILAMSCLDTTTGFAGGWRGGGWRGGGWHGGGWRGGGWHGGYYGGRRYWNAGYYRWNGGWRWWGGGFNPWWVFLPPIVPVPFPYPYYGGYGYGQGYGYGPGYGYGGGY